MANQTIGHHDCPICGKQADVRETKKLKTYILCGDCGFQGFTRGFASDKTLREKMRKVDAAGSDPGQPIPGATKTPEKPPQIKILAGGVPIDEATPKDAKSYGGIVRHTADGESVPGVQIAPPPARELTIFDKEFYTGEKA